MNPEEWFRASQHVAEMMEYVASHPPGLGLREYWARCLPENPRNTGYTLGMEKKLGTGVRCMMLHDFACREAHHSMIFHVNPNHSPGS